PEPFVAGKVARVRWRLRVAGERRLQEAPETQPSLDGRIPRVGGVQVMEPVEPAVLLRRGQGAAEEGIAPLQLRPPLCPQPGGERRQLPAVDPQERLLLAGRQPIAGDRRRSLELEEPAEGGVDAEASEAGLQLSGAHGWLT